MKQDNKFLLKRFRIKYADYFCSEHNNFIRFLWPKLFEYELKKISSRLLSF